VAPQKETGIRIPNYREKQNTGRFAYRARKKGRRQKEGQKVKTSVRGWGSMRANLLADVLPKETP